MHIMKDNPKRSPVLHRTRLYQLTQRIHRKGNNPWQKWLLLAALSFALAGQSLRATPDFLIPPGAVEPGGGTNDTEVAWCLGFGGPPGGSASMEYVAGVSSEPNIAGSIYMILDCVGGAVQNSTNIQSPNLALFLSMSDDFVNCWFGDPTYSYYNLGAYSSISFDIKVNTEVSSNTDIPLAFWAQYNNDRLEPLSNDGQVTDLNAATDGWGMGLTNASNWTHVVIPITPVLIATAAGPVDGFGCYLWYNTGASTPPAHLEFWIDNMRLTALTAPPPPPTLALENLPRTGLLLDSGLEDATFRHEIWTVNSVPWEGNSSSGSPMTYSMTISAVPNPALYPNWEANIFLAPNDSFSNPENNGTDVGWLQILDSTNGTATATMHWKTNSAFDYSMLYNTQFGGAGGTNNDLAAGLLGTLTAPSMVGTWSISFTSDTNLTVQGPGGVSTNLSIPEAWLQVWDADAAMGGPVAYAYFGDDSFTETNQGLMWLSSVSISGGTSGDGVTNTFDAALDLTTWAAANNTTVVSTPSLLVSWSSPADFYTLEATTALGGTNEWVAVTNNPTVPISIYQVYTNVHAIVADTDLPGTNSTFFALFRSVAVGLQVLMPGETNAPGTPTGKIGTPIPQTVGNAFNVTVNALDFNGNIMTGCSDPVNITSSDPAASGVGVQPLSGGSLTFVFTFGTAGAQTISVADEVDSTVSATGSSTTVNP
jgi:hypothetical protein